MKDGEKEPPAAGATGPRPLSLKSYWATYWNYYTKQMGSGARGPSRRRLFLPA